MLGFEVEGEKKKYLKIELGRSKFIMEVGGCKGQQQVEACVIEWCVGQ